MDNFTDLGGGVKRRILNHNKDIMMVEVHFDSGSVGKAHTHVHSQSTYVLEGSFEFTIDGEKVVVNKGDNLIFQPNSLHGTVCLEKGILIDVFSPQREDFL